MEHLILVGLGGALGSVIRFELSKLPPVRDIPSGTAVVNILGSFLFSLVFFSQSPGDAYYLIDMGILGGFTTFSTFTFETFRMLEEREYQTMFTNLLIHLIGSLGGVSLAYFIISQSMAGV
ncbi:MAG: CrcB family protein [Methanobacteriota archaeon]